MDQQIECENEYQILNDAVREFERKALLSAKHRRYSDLCELAFQVCKAVGRWTNADPGTDYGGRARVDLFAAYERWCELRHETRGDDGAKGAVEDLRVWEQPIPREQGRTVGSPDGGVSANAQRSTLDVDGDTGGRGAGERATDGGWKDVQLRFKRKMMVEMLEMLSYRRGVAELSYADVCAVLDLLKDTGE